MMTVAARPVNMMQNCTTSFQITAWIPPSIVYSVTNVPTTMAVVLRSTWPPDAALIARLGTYIAVAIHPSLHTTKIIAPRVRTRTSKRASRYS